MPVQRRNGGGGKCRPRAAASPLVPPLPRPRLLTLDETWLEQLPAPNEAVIFVEEDHIGDIIGYWMVLQTYHLEPAWVRPDHRGGLVIKRLFGAIRQFLDTCRISKAFCSTEHPSTAGYLTRLGFTKLPGESFQYENDSESN